MVEGLVGSCVGHGGLHFFDLFEGGSVELRCHGVDHLANGFECGFQLLRRGGVVVVVSGCIGGHGLVEFGHEASDKAEPMEESVGFRALDAAHGETVENLGDGDKDGVFGMKRREFERLVLVRLPAFDVLVRSVVETEAGAADGG